MEYIVTFYDLYSRIIHTHKHKFYYTMKQLITFLQKLRDAGIETKCLAEHKFLNGKRIEFWLLRANGRYCQVVFQVYGEERGFGMYIDTGFVNINEDLKLIQKRLS